MKMLFVALLAFVPCLTAALSVTGVDVGRLLILFIILQMTHLQPNNDDIKLLKDRILGKISYFQLLYYKHITENHQAKYITAKFYEDPSKRES
jgi:hypothetical protein